MPTAVRRRKRNLLINDTKSSKTVCVTAKVFASSMIVCYNNFEGKIGKLEIEMHSAV